MARHTLYRAASLPALLLIIIALPVVLLVSAFKRLRSRDEPVARAEYVLLPPTNIRP